MGQKWEENDHKIPKNGLNDPKIVPNMYFNGFYQILKNFWKILKIGHFMPEKPRFYAFSRRDFWRENVREKFIAARPDDPIGLIFGTYAPTYIYNNSMDWIWLIFIFGWDMGSFVDQEGLFSQKIIKNHKK